MEANDPPDACAGGRPGMGSGAPEGARFGQAFLVFAPVAFMLLAILAVGVARVRLLGAPLERDEGEYAYMGQLMLQGVAPYGTAANMKLPGTSAAYALSMAIFGQTTIGIHLGLLLVNAGSIVLVYFLARRLLGSFADLAAAAIYAVLSVSAAVFGVWAHATHFVVLPALGGMLLLLKWADCRKASILFWSGVLFGTAILMKQPGALFAVFGLFYLLYSQRNQWPSGRWPVLRSLMVFGGAVALPFGVMCGLLWRAGVFDKFWFWVFTYGRQYVSTVSASVGVTLFLDAVGRIAEQNGGILLIAAGGLFVLWRYKRNRMPAVFVTGLLVCSFLAVCPGLYFRGHYFVLLLPALALLAAAPATTAKQTAFAALPLWIIAGALASAFWLQGGYLFQMSPPVVSRAIYDGNPFPEAVKIAAYIRAHTGNDDRIAVLGSEPELYFYSARKSATSYLYIYPLVEAQPLAAHMQGEFIDDLEAMRPKYLVFVKVATSWLIQPDSPHWITEWAQTFSTQYYEKVGVVDIFADGTVYRWDSEAVNYKPKSSASLLVLRRKEDGALSAAHRNK